jgi:hypothetical protein
VKLTVRVWATIVLLLVTVAVLTLHPPRQRSLAKSGYSVVYEIGTLSDVKPGTRLRLRIMPRGNGSQILLSSGNNTMAYLPSNSVTGFVYKGRFLDLSWHYGQDILALPLGE